MKVRPYEESKAQFAQQQGYIEKQQYASISDILDYLGDVSPAASPSSEDVVCRNILAKSRTLRAKEQK